MAGVMKRLEINDCVSRFDTRSFFLPKANTGRRPLIVAVTTLDRFFYFEKDMVLLS